MEKKAAVINLGCPKNQVDSEVITGILAESFDIIADPSEANIVIVNTCGFIDDAKEESIKVLCEMAELKNNGLCERVYAMGCLAQRYGKKLLEEIPELDGVLGDGDLRKVTMIQDSGNQRIYTTKKVQDFIYSHEMPRIRLEPNFSAYVKIAEGCDNHCSYCAIPMIKGRYRSRTIESIVEESKRLGTEGVKEIVLVAQDTTRYGMERYGRFALPELLKELIKIQGIEWIRLMYCYPDVFSAELIEIIGRESKICKYVDLPLQHADNEILAQMNRRNTVEEAERLIEKLRKEIPEIFIRSTFITGFPGETEEQFNRLLSFVRRVKLDRLGVFAYSKEDNTPAGKRKDQIPVQIRKERQEILMALQAEMIPEIQKKREGKVLRVILEERLAELIWLGRTEGDAPEIDGQIYLKVKKEHTSGDIINAQIQCADSYDMEGEGLE